MTGLEQQTELLKLVGSLLKKKIKCYMIGGSAMLFYGLKTVTKDIDLVFTSEEEISLFRKSLEETGFAKKSYEIHKREPANEQCILMERKEERFDLFLNDIVTTKLSPGIVNRIREKHEFSGLTVNVISPEDIIVLKCATDRAGDRKDAADIMNSREISWDTILGEAKWQAENGKMAFVILLFDFVNDLVADYKAPVPRDFLKILRKEHDDQLKQILGREKYNEMAKGPQRKR